MTSLLLYGYYYKYADARKTIKQDLINNNISTAATKLDQYLAENDSYVTTKNVTTTFAVEDNLRLKHAKDHMNNVTIPKQKQATIDALSESADIVPDPTI